MIEITEYQSVLFTGPGPDMLKTLLSAHGTINDVKYDYVRLDEDVKPGVIAAWFIREAELGFARRELANMEREND